jgi:hypothetical protein
MLQAFVAEVFDHSELDAVQEETWTHVDSPCPALAAMPIKIHRLVPEFATYLPGMTKNSLRSRGGRGCTCQATWQALQPDITTENGMRSAVKQALHRKVAPRRSFELASVMCQFCHGRIDNPRQDQSLMTRYNRKVLH